jgi:hypothetical protein
LWRPLGYAFVGMKKQLRNVSTRVDIGLVDSLLVNMMLVDKGSGS